MSPSSLVYRQESSGIWTQVPNVLSSDYAIYDLSQHKTSTQAKYQKAEWQYSKEPRLLRGTSGPCHLLALSSWASDMILVLLIPCMSNQDGHFELLFWKSKPPVVFSCRNIDVFDQRMQFQTAGFDILHTVYATSLKPDKCDLRNPLGPGALDKGLQILKSCFIGLLGGLNKLFYRKLLAQLPDCTVLHKHLLLS